MFLWFEAFCGDVSNESLFISLVKRYQTANECKKAHLKTRNRGHTIYCSRRSWEKWSTSKLYNRYILSFSRFNSQKRQFLCSFLKHNKVWIQKLRLLRANVCNWLSKKQQVNIKFSKSIYIYLKILWKSGQILHVNAVYVINSNWNCKEASLEASVHFLVFWGFFIIYLCTSNVCEYYNVHYCYRIYIIYI